MFANFLLEVLQINISFDTYHLACIAAYFWYQDLPVYIYEVGGRGKV